MYKITNKLDRRVGLPADGFEGFILDIGESREVSNEHRKALVKVPRTITLIATGAIVDEKVVEKKSEK